MEYPNSLYLIVIIFVLAGVSISALAVAIQALNRETIVQVQGNSIAPTSLVQSYTPVIRTSNTIFTQNPTPNGPYGNYLIEKGICTFNVTVIWQNKNSASNNEVYVNGPTNVPIHVDDSDFAFYYQPLATNAIGVSYGGEFGNVVALLQPDGDSTRIVFRLNIESGGSIPTNNLTSNSFDDTGLISVSGSFLVASTT